MGSSSDRKSSYSSWETMLSDSIYLTLHGRTQILNQETKSSAQCLGACSGVTRHLLELAQGLRPHFCWMRQSIGWGTSHGEDKYKFNHSSVHSHIGRICWLCHKFLVHCYPGLLTRNNWQLLSTTHPTTQWVGVIFIPILEMGNEGTKQLVHSSSEW